MEVTKGTRNALPKSIAQLRPIRTSGAEKDVFTPEHIQHLLEVAEGDWKRLILSGYFTGGRLVDLARLIWGDIDLSEKTITFAQGKTGSSVQIPIHQDLYEHLLELPRSDRPKEPVFPKLFNRPGAGKSGLSISFKRLMACAGIDDGLARKKDGKFGRNVPRLSFHSLRHSFSSAMANADVPLEIRQKLTGHASRDMNKQYTHLELETVRRPRGLFRGCRAKVRCAPTKIPHEQGDHTVPHDRLFGCFAQKTASFSFSFRPQSHVYRVKTDRGACVMEFCDFAPQVNMLIAFEVRAEIEVRSIHTLQSQEMHSAKGISGNDRPIIVCHCACCHVPIHG
jgi:hypothetical protein